MNQKINVLTINGIEYVPKDEVSKRELAGDYVLIRTYSAGVFMGIIVERNGKEAKVKNARRIWYWDGAATLSQLAIDGTSKPENCKFPESVEEIILTEVIEIISMTKKAVNSLNGVKIWSIN